MDLEQNKKITDLYGEDVFNETVMRNRLPKSVFRSLMETRAAGKALDSSVAEVVAAAMKDWALEKGVTHFTHWFHPMTGITAEKHDSFISPTPDGHIIMEFSGKELIKGEPDASSFPSGGLRATFEARGYTAWDVTSDAFIKDGSLYIPTAFCSYSGEALDKKTPLLRSMQAVDLAAKRILKLFGKEPQSVVTTVGAEQEYFLIDEKLHSQREDLIYAGRTLFGAKPPKGQELDDHYFGNLKTRISNYMKELDLELWKLGIAAKTKHNEVAPAQHELACVFNTSNITTDQNQLVMELMKKVAKRHGLYCLLNEKPFAGVNGSGKHNNWSLSTSDGENLLEPGHTPEKNACFLLFLVAVIKAVDEYADLLRVSVASPSNDHRLGAHEAPPAVIAIFLGDQLTSILDSIEKNTEPVGIGQALLDVGVETLPNLILDTTDRNRTSPFAFTGNKFEFRMPGSSVSVADPNIVLNTIVAESLSQLAKDLEKADHFDQSLMALIRDTYIAHKRIIYNGNNYSEEWLNIAEERGLSNLRTTVDALPCLLERKNISVYEKNHVLSEVEVLSRYEIRVENYNKAIHIEALTMLDMTKRQILPSVLAYQKDIADTLGSKKAAGPFDTSLENTLLGQLSDLGASLLKSLKRLDETVLGLPDEEKVEGIVIARYYKDTVIPAMQELRAVADTLETVVAKCHWPFPVYGDLLYRV